VIVDLTVKFAKENPDWGYDRISGALSNVGYHITDTTVVAATFGVPGIEVAVLDLFVLHFDVPKVVGLQELFLTAGLFIFHFQLLLDFRRLRLRWRSVGFLSTIEGAFSAPGSGEDGGRAADTVGLEDASQVGVA